MLKFDDLQMFKGDPVNIWGERIKTADNIISLEVTEKLNDGLSLIMVCAVSDDNVKNLVIGNIIKCHKDILKEELFSFEIYDVRYSFDHKITVKAEHISSRLRYIYVEPIPHIYGYSSVGGVLSGGTYNGKYYLINHTGVSPITIRTPYEPSNWDSRLVVSDSVKSIIDIMRGTSGSLLDMYGHGYWRYMHDTEMLFEAGEAYSRRDPVLEPITYSRNMSDFNREIDMDHAKSNQVLFWRKDVDGVIEQAWACRRRNDDVYFLQASQLVDLSSRFETKPTAAQLIAAAPSVSTSPEVTTNCSVVGYEGLATCGRQIQVIFPEFGVQEEMRITETTYDVMTGRYKVIKLGTLKKTLSKTIAEITGKTGVSVY